MIINSEEEQSYINISETKNDIEYVLWHFNYYENSYTRLIGEDRHVFIKIPFLLEDSKYMEKLIKKISVKEDADSDSKDEEDDNSSRKRRIKKRKKNKDNDSKDEEDDNSSIKKRRKNKDSEDEE